MNWSRIDLEAANGFLNLAGAATSEGPARDDLERQEREHWRRIGDGQLDGAVALYNRLADRHLVWLADEVGMGKTFVALAVAALVRHEHPEARILFLLPSSRLQPKWVTEMRRFVECCVRVVDHRARTFQGTPLRPQVTPRRLRELAADLLLDPDRDVLATLHAFSLGLVDDEGVWQHAWSQLTELSPVLPRRLDRALYVRDGRADKAMFKRIYAAALNAILPTFDLVICDESHNLRGGLGAGAARNQTLAAALGGYAAGLPELPWPAPRPRVKRLLCLTATPVERTFRELRRQADVFGVLRFPGCPESTLRDLDRFHEADEDGMKEVATRYIVRRMHALYRPGVERGLTKNQYRREWRQGGVEAWDEALALASPAERLIVALVQKKVIELLHAAGDRPGQDFLPSFQMGMLSSFESFGQTIGRRARGAASERAPGGDEEFAGDGDAVFDGDQVRDVRHAKGLDTELIDTMSADFRETFRRSPPHPKLDKVAAAAACWAERGEKSLVFVRRVRTTEELADKVSDLMSQALITRLRGLVPEATRGRFERVVEAYRTVRGATDAGRPLAADGGSEDDEGEQTSFFAWFFRGQGDGEVRLGGHLRKRAIQDLRQPWSTLLHDNHVLWLFDDAPARVLEWFEAHDREVRVAASHCLARVANVGAGHRYEAWQAGALHVLGAESGSRGEAARWLRSQLATWHEEPAEDLGDGSMELVRRPFFTRLRGHPLRGELWPGSDWEEVSSEGLAGLRERELRRELLATALRIGAAWVDLWLSAVIGVGHLEAPTAAEAEAAYDGVITELLTRLGDQDSDGSRELRGMAAHHRLLLGLNFDEAGKKRLDELRVYLSNRLARQAPAVALHGGSKSEQVLRQFRMPGYPYVIVATDVVQEGVDLHTFCKRVIHYGVACSSSATEQRTGRVDRIGSLVHREFALGDEDTKLQVHYPHLQQSVEPLQLRELYRRIDTFLRMVHGNLGSVEREKSAVDLGAALGDEIAYPAPYEGRLETAFGVTPEDRVGGELCTVEQSTVVSAEAVRTCLAGLVSGQPERVGPEGSARWRGEVWWVGEQRVPSPGDGARCQPFDVALRTRRDGGGVFLRVRSPVGEMDLSDGRSAGGLLRADRWSRGVVLMAQVAADGRPQRGALKRGGVFVEARCDVPVWSADRLEDLLTLALEEATWVADQVEKHWYAGEQDHRLRDVSRRWT